MQHLVHLSTKDAELALSHSHGGNIVNVLHRRIDRRNKLLAELGNRRKKVIYNQLGLRG